MDNWKKTSNRYVAFLDILGFKELVLKSEHEVLLKRLEKISSVLDMLNTKITPLGLTKVISFSDSILIISNDDSFECAKQIVKNVNWVLGSCISELLPLKGAIAHGKFTADFEKSIFFGQPLIDSYLLQDELKLYGAILHHSAEQELLKLKSDEISNFLTSYNGPINNLKIRHFFLNYISAIDYVYKGNKKREELCKNLYNSVSGIPRKYVDNTIEFIKFIDDSANN